MSGVPPVAFAENQHLSWPQQHTDSGSSRRTVNAREDGQALGFDFGFKPIHRFLWSEGTENDHQSVWRQRISRAGKAPARLGSV
jgi:hypothetical protein